MRSISSGALFSKAPIEDANGKALRFATVSVYAGFSAVASGELPIAVVDRAVRRILVQLDRFGLLGTGRPRPVIDAKANATVAREVAIAGAVLLRNVRDLLPLGGDDLRDLAVIGPTAQRPLVGGGGSARVIPAAAESPLNALTRQAGRHARIRFADGIDLDGIAVPAAALTLTRTQTGGATETVTQINHVGATALPAGTAWTWTGTLTAPETGEYDLRIQGTGGSISATLDGIQIGSLGGLFGGNARLLATADGLNAAGTSVTLQAGQAKALRVTATGAAGVPLQVRFAWVSPARRQQYLDAAVTLARSAHTVVVFAFNEGTEGVDRASLALPDRQDVLLDAVARANSRTAVVLNTGDPVLMPWVDRVRSVLQMWYPGQEGAGATADLLLGSANPGGRLPVTYPRRYEDVPTAPVERYPGVDGKSLYNEGLLMGYRHYDANGIEPLFPFGHGLSYTSFRYGDLEVRQRNGRLTVTFTVRNTGRRSGSDAPQVYLTPPDRTPVPMAPRTLVGFSRVTLRPGERRTVTITIDRRALSYWSPTKNEWQVATGRRTVLVGASSRDLRLRESVTVR